MASIHLLFIPSLLTALWAFYFKIKERNYKDTILLALLALAAYVNGVLVYQMIVKEVTPGGAMLQMLAAATIVPNIYVYFARKIGTRISNIPAITAMWACVPFCFIPNIIIYNPFEPLIYPETGIAPFTIYVLSHGEKVFYMGIGDLIVTIQTCIAVFRISMFMRLLRQHKLQLNRKIYALAFFWAATVAFIVTLTAMPYEYLSTSMGMWCYYGAYSLLILTMNFLIALHYDDYPVETEHGEVVEDLDVYVESQFGAMASELRYKVEKEELFRDSSLSSERMIEILGTNRTYFSRMMSKEIGMTFSEYLNSLRFEQVQKLLKDHSLTMGEIAIKCGFNDSNYMGRKFKEKFGVTPSAWRKGNNAEGQQEKD